MGVSLTVLGSGSRGNATVIATSRTRLLVDAGFSRRELLRRLALCGLEAESFDAILISHEHSDHVSGLARLAAQLPRPVFLTPTTLAALGATGRGLERVELFAAGVGFTIGDIEITPFSIPHDAADPVAFRFRAEGVNLAVVTDLGYFTANVKDQLRGVDLAMIESNHDLEMLKAGGYPWDLKQRVMGRLGHLSNDSLAEFLATDFDGHAAHLILAHLSENNNLPSLARLAAERALARFAAPPATVVAAQHEPLPTVAF